MAPAANDTLYSRDYFLGDCDGHREFRRSQGRTLPRRLKKCWRLLSLQPGERFLDVGCGRGEIVLRAASACVRAVGADPARAAMEICGRPADSQPASGPSAAPLYVRAEGERLPFAAGAFDAILAADVVEHLRAPELARVLRECTRVLRPGGRVLIHTQPNRTLVDWTVPVVSRLSWLWQVRVPRDLRAEMSPGSGREYHTNEQSLPGLRRAILAAGLVIDEIWLEGTYPIHRLFGSGGLHDAVLRSFRKSTLLKRLLASQIFARARRPPSN